jgi:hypothetical protein
VRKSQVRRSCPLRSLAACYQHGDVKDGEKGLEKVLRASEVTGTRCKLISWPLLPKK